MDRGLIWLQELKLSPKVCFISMLLKYALFKWFIGSVFGFPKIVFGELKQWLRAIFPNK